MRKKFYRPRLTEFCEHAISSGRQQGDKQNSDNSKAEIQPSMSRANPNDPPTKAEIPRQKPFRGSPFSWKKSCDACGKGTNFEVRIARHFHPDGCPYGHGK
ncbi:MAG: hypothetical protein ONB47_19295 [candidate division KSB1 bacterium]|nr:hypothetical protein [candidate division KSB1 bacterium]